MVRTPGSACQAFPFGCDLQKLGLQIHRVGTVCQPAAFLGVVPIINSPDHPPAKRGATFRALAGFGRVLTMANRTTHALPPVLHAQAHVLSLVLRARS